MTGLALSPLDPKTREAWRQFAGTCAQQVLSDLEEQVPGDFCPENQYVTAYHLGMLAVLRMMAVRIAEATQRQEPTLEQTES